MTHFHEAPAFKNHVDGGLRAWRCCLRSGIAVVPEVERQYIPCNQCACLPASFVHSSLPTKELLLHQHSLSSRMPLVLRLRATGLLSLSSTAPVAPTASTSALQMLAMAIERRPKRRSSTTQSTMSRRPSLLLTTSKASSSEASS